jgi:hypothetical protein
MDVGMGGWQDGCVMAVAWRAAMRCFDILISADRLHCCLGRKASVSFWGPPAYEQHDDVFGCPPEREQLCYQEGQLEAIE